MIWLPSSAGGTVQSRSEGEQVGIMVSFWPACPERSQYSQGESRAGQHSSPTHAVCGSGAGQGLPHAVRACGHSWSLWGTLAPGRGWSELSLLWGSFPGLPPVTPNTIRVGLGREYVVLIPTSPEVWLLLSGHSQAAPLEVGRALTATQWPAG